MGQGEEGLPRGQWGWGWVADKIAKALAAAQRKHDEAFEEAGDILVPVDTD